MLAGKRATSGPIAESEARSATVVERGGTLARCVGSPEEMQEVVVKTGRSLPVWRLRRDPKRRGVTVGRVSTARLLGMCGNHG
jgi:hypothetical protein